MRCQAPEFKYIAIFELFNCIQAASEESVLNMQLCLFNCNEDLQADTVTEIHMYYFIYAFGLLHNCDIFDTGL